MKKITKLKLTQLSKSELDEKQMNALSGASSGCFCGCGGCLCSGDIDVMDSTDGGFSEYTSTVGHNNKYVGRY